MLFQTDRPISVYYVVYYIGQRTTTGWDIFSENRTTKGVCYITLGTLQESNRRVLTRHFLWLYDIH